MDLKHKHLAVISAGALIAIFLGLAVWYMVSHPAPVAIAPGVATTTPAEVTPTDKTIIDLQKYYEIRAKYPLSVPTQDGGAYAQRTMEKWVTDQIATFKSDSKLDSLTPEDIKMQGLDQGQMYALTIAYKLHTSSSTISYDYEIYANTLGAHPNTYYHTFTFDKQTGALLELSDLFKAGTPYLDLLSTRTRADLPAIIDKQSNGGGADTSDITYGTAPKIESFQNFYIENGNLVIVFAPYQVGPYALGTVLDPIPLSSLKASLNSKYLP
ncbi:MAG: hypothetical protein JWN49_175 [Parcubacteria group bacterium]|nr:hypothetical protein [Parcubacteria group bacterium]